MPQLEQHPTSFLRAEFDGWLTQRRADEGLAPIPHGGGRPVFKSWLRDRWDDIRELPEARGLGLFCERDVTMIVAEVAEDVMIGGQLCAVSVFEILPINRPKRADVLTACAGRRVRRRQPHRAR